MGKVAEAGGGLGVAPGGIWWPDGGGCVVAEKGLGWCCLVTWCEVGEIEKRNVCVSVCLLG